MDMMIFILWKESSQMIGGGGVVSIFQKAKKIKKFTQKNMITFDQQTELTSFLSYRYNPVDLLNESGLYFCC